MDHYAHYASAWRKIFSIERQREGARLTYNIIFLVNDRGCSYKKRICFEIISFRSSPSLEAVLGRFFSALFLSLHKNNSVLAMPLSSVLYRRALLFTEFEMALFFFRTNLLQLYKGDNTYIPHRTVNSNASLLVRTSKSLLDDKKIYLREMNLNNIRTLA